MHEKATGVAYSMAAFTLWLGTLDWSTISMVVGILLGIATFFVNWHYKRKNSKIYEEAVKRGYYNEPDEEYTGRTKK